MFHKEKTVKTTKVFYLLGFLVWIGTILIIVLGYLSLRKEEHPLHEFIIGRWIGEYVAKENGIPYRESYQVEFIQPNKLILNLKTKQFTKYNNVYIFEFTGENKIEIRSRNVDEWELIRANDSLYIRSGGNLVRYVPFRRAPRISWEIITGVLIVGIFMVTIFPVKQGNLSLKKMVPTSNRNLLHSFLTYVVMGITFLIGWSASIMFWESYAMRTIRLPWDAMISIEIGILIILFSIKVSSIGRKLINLSSIYFYVLFFTGITIFGWGSYGLVLGLLRLIVVICFGQYPPA